MPHDTLLLVITLVLVLIALFLIPTLIQVKNTAQRAEEFMREAQRDLLPLMQDLRQASARLNKLSAEAEEGLSQAEPFFQSLGDVGSAIHRVSGFLRGDFGQVMGNAIGLWLGIRAASKSMLKEFKPRKGGQ